MNKDGLKNAVVALLARRTSPVRAAEIGAAVGLNMKVFAESRELDRTMQKLRKEGRVRATSLGWVVASRTPCEHCGGTGWAPR